jgi:hypothetical protein
MASRTGPRARTLRTEQCARPARRSPWRSLPRGAGTCRGDRLPDRIASGLTGASLARRITATAGGSAFELERRVPMLLRKEVIQPHLPVRLPCYDFTPIADPTFDGSLPCGLGHRLRVLPTFVV